MDTNQGIRQRRLKAGTACTNCRKKKLRCTGMPNCARCFNHKLDCVVDEVIFLKTSSPQKTFSKAANGVRAALSSSSSSALASPSLHSQQQCQRQRQRQQQQSSHDYNPYDNHGNGSSPSCSSFCSGDEMEEQKKNLLIDTDPSDRRISDSTGVLGICGRSATLAMLTDCVAESSNATVITKRRASMDHGSIKPTQTRKRRRSSKQDLRTVRNEMKTSTSGEDSASVNSAMTPRSSSPKSTKKSEKVEYKSMVSTMSLDGHGQHFHGSSSGFYICQLSSRFRQGIYPLPMAYLNDSDLWSHSLQMTSERELPPREMMNNLLNLYFQYMYPFAPIFIRKTFMEHHLQNRPDLSQILLLNAIFCNACRYSDDVAVKQESTKYFNRAKIILDETYHISKITTTQALMLMSHHQYATGNYSGGWLYSGMAIRIAVDLGLHRQDVHTDEPEYKEVRKRVWWALYISDRLGSGVLGRPMTLRDEAFNIDLPSDEWIPHVIGEDVVEYPYEPERIISCRLLWSIKLFMHMGKMLNTMHCIEAEVSGTFLADMSRSQLPQIHNSLTSWFMSLPTELMYAPYTMSPGTSHPPSPPSPPTALMHMFYYTCLTMLHRPYLRLVNSSAIDSNFLLSSRNICTAAATNVCHIADSLMLHGQLRDTCFYGMSCLFAAGTVHVHNAMTPTLSNQETTRAGISKTVKAAQELVKTFPVAESLIAIALDVFASHKSSLPSDMETSFVDISTFVAPLMDKTQLQSTSIGNIHEAARLATLTKDGPESAPSIQLRHPYGDFSMPLPTETSLKTVGDSDPCSSSSSNNKEGGRSIKLGIVWQTQIATAVAMAAIAFGGTDPTLQPESDMPQEQHFFANSLELPEALRLAPIDTMTTISQVDRMVPPVTTNTSTSVSGIAVGGSGVDYGLDVFGTSGPLGLGHIQSVGEGNGVEVVDHGMQQWMHQQQQQQLYFQQFQEQHQHRQQQQQQQGSTVAVHVSHAGGAMMLGSYSQSSSDPHSGNVDSSDGSSTSNINNTSLLTEEPITSILMQELSSLHTPALQIEMHMQKQEGQQQQQQQRYATMEDYGADPLTPPAISSDDMDIEASSLSDSVDHVKYSRSDNNIGSPKRALQGAMSAVPERELESAQ